MKISIRGTDEGNATLTALILIVILSTLFAVLASRIGAAKHYAGEYKAMVLREINESNMEAVSRYDIH